MYCFPIQGRAWGLSGATYLRPLTLTPFGL